MNDKNETWTVFGDRLKSELERQGLTLTQISKKTGMPLPTLSRYAKSQRIPLATQILRVAEALGVTCDYMLGLSDDPHKTRLRTKLPSAHPGWIPCDRELPKPNDEDGNGFHKAYLVQDGRWMDVARWDGNYWIAWGYSTVLLNVVAWMPLPESYREEEQDAY